MIDGHIHSDASAITVVVFVLLVCSHKHGFRRQYYQFRRSWAKFLLAWLVLENKRMYVNVVNELGKISASSIKVGSTGICFRCAFLMFSCSLFVFLVNGGIEVCYLVTQESRVDENAPPAPCEILWSVKNKASFFGYLACTFVEFMCSRRTQLLHIFQIHCFMLHIASEGGGVPPKLWQHPSGILILETSTAAGHSTSWGMGCF